MVFVVLFEAEGLDHDLPGWEYIDRHTEEDRHGEQKLPNIDGNGGNRCHDHRVDGHFPLMLSQE